MLEVAAMGPVAYEGSEKYIFVSYAHRDSERVLHIVEKLMENGYRVWYDEGIVPGSEWPEDIATHLNNCAVCLAFISNNSMESANCRREITFALSKQKPFLGIVLEPTNMSLGMEMQLSAQQCILCSNYQKEEDFFRKLFSTPDLKCCWEAPAQPEPVKAEPAPTAPVQEPTAIPQPQPQPHPVQTAVPPKKKKSSKGLLIGAVAAVLLIVIVVICLRPAGGPGSFDTGKDSMTLRGQSITAETVEKLNKMANLKFLYIYESTVQDDALKNLQAKALRYLTIQDTQVADFRFLENSPELRSLDLINCGVTDANLPALPQKDLSSLTIKNNPQFSDLSKINVTALRTVDLSNTAVSDVSVLAQASNLGELNCSYTKVSSIEALAPLENLRVMEFAYCPIAAVETPFMSLSMQVLNFNKCGLQNTNGFQNFTVLQRVYLAANGMADISWLAKSTATLKEVNIAGNSLKKENFSFLENAVELTSLNVSYLPLGDVSLLKNLTKLNVLYASHCELQDISGLSGLVNLKELHLDHNRLESLTGLPAMNSQTFPVLDLAYNEITDPSPITGEKFYAVALQGNPVDATKLANAKGTVLAVDYQEGMAGGNKPGFTKICIVDCPADKQLALQSAWGGSAYCMTEEKMLEELAEFGIVYAQ